MFKCEEHFMKCRHFPRFFFFLLFYSHYSVPYIPDIPGLNSFEGILMHSHDYRENSKFRDMKVVVLGAGASGIDIGLEVADVAKEVSLKVF